MNTEPFINVCGCTVTPAEYRPDHDSKLTQMFFRQRPHIAAKFDDVQEVVLYSPCFNCGEMTSHDELVRAGYMDNWVCEQCEAEVVS